MRNHVSEHDEFLLSQLLDGDLSEQEAADLRRRMDAEPALREAFEEFSRLNALVGDQRSRQPAVDYDQFHRQLMQHIAPARVHVSEQDELLLNQLLDGELAAQQEAATLARLQAEPALREAHESLVRVNAALVERRADRPSVDYDQFHRRVMNLIAAEAARVGGTIRFPVWARFAAPLAAAAAIALVVWMHPGVQQLQPADEPRIEVVQRDDPVGQQPSTDTLMARTSPPEPVTIVRVGGPSTPAHQGTIEVQFGKSMASRSPSPAVEVSFARSTDIAEEIRRVDEERAAQPSRKVFFASANTSAITDGLSGDLF